MAKMGKKKLQKGKNDKQKFKGQTKKRFERDIRPMKKRKQEGSDNKRVLTKKQLKKNFFSARQFEQKEFEAKKITDDGVLRRIEDDDDDNETVNPYAEFLNIFGVKHKAQSAHKDDDQMYEDEDDDEFEDDDDDDEEEVDDDDQDDDDQDDITDDKDNDVEEDEEVDDGDEDEEEEEEEAEVEEVNDDALDHYKEHFKTLEVKEAANLLKPDKWSVEKIKVPHLGEATVSYHPLSHAPQFNFENVDIDKSCIKSHILKQFKALNKKNPSGFLSEFQSSLFPIINSYTDLYFPSRTFKNSDELVNLYCLHALNHVTKIRNIVIKNNTKIKAKIEKKLKNKKKKKKNEEEDDDDDSDIQDQGYARPKVLIVVPFRSCALKIVNTLIHLLASEKAMVSQKNRFMEEYGSPEEERKKGLKPGDFEETFVGNTDENFKIGISIAKKTLKLYNEFYSSDIIIASPIGLKDVLEPEEKGVKKPGDHMFLSSIEILIIDQSDVLLMQNWNNVLTVLDHLNKQPDGKFAVDISRIKDWYINGWQHLYRQTLVFSSFQTPEINGTFQKFATNYKGKCIIPAIIPKPTMCNIVSSLPQTFRRFPASNIGNVADARFQFFIKRVLPVFRNSSDEHVIIFIPSYYDFVRIRKHLKKEEVEFEEICEYTQRDRVSRARQFFFEGRMKYLLYTERFHYYYRYFVRGIHHLIFYDLPVNAQFYPELCNMVVDYKKEIVPVNTSCTVLYNKYDVQKLVRIVGSERTNVLINSDEDVFSYASMDN